MPAGYVLPHDDTPILDLSVDGQTLVFAADGESGRILFRRKLSETAAQPIQGTEGAKNPFLSPDGQWVGFFVDGDLKKVPIAGGTPIALASVAARCREAMRAHPVLVAGAGRLDTDVISLGVLCKSGAEGLLCCLVGDEGVAIKTRDGSSRAIFKV